MILDRMQGTHTSISIFIWCRWMILAAIEYNQCTSHWDTGLLMITKSIVYPENFSIPCSLDEVCILHIQSDLLCSKLFVLLQLYVRLASNEQTLKACCNSISLRCYGSRWVWVGEWSFVHFDCRNQFEFHLIRFDVNNWHYAISIFLFSSSAPFQSISFSLFQTRPTVALYSPNHRDPSWCGMCCIRLHLVLSLRCLSTWKPNMCQIQFHQ